MPRPLKVLIVEDNPADAELVLRQLRRAGFTPEWVRVDREPEYLANLHTGLDVILSDYEMPQFNGLRALELLRASGLDIPAILISGTIGEDTAVAAMKQGAVDYLLKDRLTRLGPAVDHALEQSKLRQDRKEAARALRDSEERFREVVQNIEDVFWMTNLEKTEMLFVSAAYEKIWGRTCASLYASPMTWTDAIHPDDRDRVLRSATTDQTAGGFHEEYRIIRPDGSLRWINDRAFPVRDAGGVVHRMAGVARDVTGRREAEAALRIFRAQVDQSADSFEVVDPASGRFLDVSEQALSESGYTREEFLGMRVCDIDPFVTEAAWPEVAEGVRRDGVHIGEGFRRRKDGSTFPMELKAKWVQLDRSYIVAVIRNITERKQAEAELRLFRTLVDQSADAFEVIDPATGRFLDVNERGHAGLGYTREEFLTLRVCDVTPTVTESSWPQLMENIRATGLVSHESLHRRKNGTEFSIEFSAKWVQLDRAYIVAVIRDITMRKHAEAELRLFRTLVDQSADAFEVIDPVTGRFLDVNETGLVQLGCTREEYLSMRVHDIDPMITESNWPKIVDHIRHGGFDSREGIHRRKDGTTFPIELNARWVQIGHGYLVAVIRDITTRKRAEEHLREREALLANAQRIGRMGSWNLDLRSGHLAWSEATCDLFGIAPGEFDETFEHFYSFILPEDRPPCDAEQSRISPASPTLEVEYRIRRPDGEVRWMYERGNVEYDADGKQIRRLGMVMDVTERKQAEERLREQAQMLDHAHEAIIVRDFQSRQITFWNQGAERLYGWTAAEVLGRDMGAQIYVDPNARQAITEHLLRQGTWHGEHRHLSKSGKKLTVSSNSTLVRDARGHPKSVLLINIDVTEQKNLEAQFLRAQRMESIGTLASGLAHDLNNILSPIMMSVPILRRDLVPDRRDEIIEAIESSAARGAEIVKQVLTFGRGLEGEKRLLDMGPLISEVAKIIRQTFPKEIVIESSLAPGLWPLNADATQLHQILLNLCVNARDAMPDGGKLWLRAANLDLDSSYASMVPEATTGPHVLLEVSDSGTGIPPEVVERMFEPFFTTKGIGKGTGLGLSTVHGIVKSHGGFITVTSELGKGTTFQVHLPASPKDDGRDPVTTVLADSPEGLGEVILIVDDEDSVRNAARMALESFGYRVLMATDGAEGLGVFAQNTERVALLLIDLMMPIMGGTALIRALRTIAPNVPIVASTGLVERTQLEELKALGVPTVLHKPYRADTLLRTIHAALHPESSS